MSAVPNPHASPDKLDNKAAFVRVDQPQIDTFSLLEGEGKEGQRIMKEKEWNGCVLVFISR